MTTAQNIRCGACSWPLPPESWNRESAVACPGCGSRAQVAAFPAMVRAPVGASPEALGGDTEASCFYHSQNRAATPCDECGRFLCRLCEIDVDGRRICPGCFAAGVRGRKIQEVDTRRTMYDSVALALSTLPVFLFWPVFGTAPVSLFLVVRHWNSPRSIVPRTRIRFYLAALFALAEIAGVGFLIFALIRYLPSLRPQL
jgi:DNA-directed RNA polymerase subunit RPC12/RpoP